MKIYKTLENGMQFVEYEDSLAPLVADMWNRSGDGWGGDTSKRTGQQVILEHSGASFFNVFLALYKGEVVGFCSFDRYYKDGDTAYVHVLNVRPDFHGHKVGKELVLLCVNRTIELGYPRVDIHTWAGNTKAVPLYKKCGFLWEDRTDTTHLSNYIPTVLKTELTRDFFQRADWYTDSTRVIEIKPDGQKINKFEVYGYQWEYNGERLAVGFEKTGRRMRFVETNDYKIELMADSHELAFGLDYGFTLSITNKSGKPLHIKAKGKDDKGIQNQYSGETNVEGNVVLKGQFFVEEIIEPQDIWRMHPCVLMDVWVNGAHAEFGLGIEPKFPLNLWLTEKRGVSRPGLEADVYINATSALPSGAAVCFSLPENKITTFEASSFTMELEPDKSAMLHTREKILALGHEKLEVKYDISLHDGRKFSYTRPLYLTNQGIDGSFAFEDNDSYGIANGVWRLTMNKNNNHAVFNRISGGGSANISIAKLGRPFDDEFNLSKPEALRRHKDEADYMVLEADFISHKFEGVMLTRIFRISGSGVVESASRVENKTTHLQNLWLTYGLWTSVGSRGAYRFNGGFVELKDDLAYGFSDIDPEKFEENWIFDNDKKNPAGVYWPLGYKPSMKWGDRLDFEIPLGELSPGGSVTTKPVVYVYGLFADMKSFRNYVLGLDEQSGPFTENHLEITANDGNPFVHQKEEIELKVKNNYLRTLEGTVEVSSDGLFAPSLQENSADDLVSENRFTLALDANSASGGDHIHIAELSMKFAGFEKKQQLALFPIGHSPSCQVATEEKDGIFSVNNGAISFAASPSFSEAVYSLKYQGREWLFSKYPSLAPYSWWNPFVGGVTTGMGSMNARLMQREKITAAFTTQTDTYGNEWKGLTTAVHVNEFDEYKGMSMEQYYLTLPGVPILCCFVRFINQTGTYKSFWMPQNIFLSGKENLKDYFAAFQNSDGQSYRLRFGKDDLWRRFDRLIRISREGDTARKEKLYAFKDSARDNGHCGICGDINFMLLDTASSVNVENGCCFTTRPVFLILTEKELSLDALAGLEKVMFR